MTPSPPPPESEDSADRPDHHDQTTGAASAPESARAASGKKREPLNPWLARLLSGLPKREALAAHPWLKPVAHRLLEPGLWHVRHESVARGAAIGVFWAFAVPVAQFLFAAIHCVLWRGNIPVAAGLTLITNPFTVGFWLWLAYRMGSLLLGTRAPAPMADASGLVAWLTTYGGPALLGMGVFAVAGSVLTYMVVKLAWRVRVMFKRRRR